MTTDNIAYGAWSEFTLTNLVSLASDGDDTYAVWQSARVDNQTITKADDYEVHVHLAPVSGSPAHDSALYVYVVPWVYDGSAWSPGGNLGTATDPTGSVGTAVMSEPNSMKGPYVIPFKVTGQVLEGWFTIGQMCSGIVPDGWSLVVRNSTGVALADDSPSSELVIAYRPITYTAA